MEEAGFISTIQWWKFSAVDIIKSCRPSQVNFLKKLTTIWLYKFDPVELISTSTFGT